MFRGPFVRWLVASTIGVWRSEDVDARPQGSWPTAPTGAPNACMPQESWPAMRGPTIPGCWPCPLGCHGQIVLWCVWGANGGLPDFRGNPDSNCLSIHAPRRDRQQAKARLQGRARDRTRQLGYSERHGQARGRGVRPYVGREGSRLGLLRRLPFLRAPNPHVAAGSGPRGRPCHGCPGIALIRSKGQDGLSRGWRLTP
jgi:hypothetical protein